MGMEPPFTLIIENGERQTISLGLHTWGSGVGWVWAIRFWLITTWKCLLKTMALNKMDKVLETLALQMPKPSQANRKELLLPAQAIEDEN